LFGFKNPSGRLPVSFPYDGKSFLDAVVPAQFPGVSSTDGKTQTVTYTERLHIGYRWYDANSGGNCTLVRGRNPCLAFPFGHGISYTTFTIGKPNVAAGKAGAGYRVTSRITNAGKVRGSEVVQVYLSLPKSADQVGAVQPPKRLVGFQKIELAPGESGDATIIIDPSTNNHPLSVWNEAGKSWTIPRGEYKVWLGRSSSPHDLILAGTFLR
jgi:beta-glucosidase